jgi:hypothetical protein
MIKGTFEYNGRTFEANIQNMVKIDNQYHMKVSSTTADDLVENHIMKLNIGEITKMALLPR